MPRYTYQQESGTDQNVNTTDKCDAYEDTNNVRRILEDLGTLLGHSKRDDAYPKNGTAGGSLTIPAPSITTINLTGGQIAFPATQAPSANANTLDDYEEGAWTPGVSFGGGVTGITYTSTTGLYTKIGNRAFCTGYINLSSKGTDVGNALITGLPFTCKSADAAGAVPSFRFDDITFANVFQGMVTINTTTIQLTEITEAGALTTLTNANFDNTCWINLSVSYEIA